VNSSTEHGECYMILLVYKDPSIHPNYIGGMKDLAHQLVISVLANI